ncbi:MAG: DUF917 domain-containing protein [Candidatus Dormibacteria bacterium]
MPDLVGHAELDCIAIGATVLGTGGGGDPYIGKLWAQRRTDERGPVRLVPLEQVPDEALVVAVAMMGAPSVIVEKIPSGGELVVALRAVERAVGAQADALICIEAGGINSTIPFALAADLGLPVVDADGMGRAFPEVQMVSFATHGLSATPMALADERGNVTVIECQSPEWAERLGRAIVSAEGGAAVIAQYPMRGVDLKRTAIAGTIGLAYEIGRTVLGAGRRMDSLLHALTTQFGAAILFRGKVIELERRTEGGFLRGFLTIAGLGEQGRKSCSISFQNENLVASTEGEVLASVPDLITILEEDSGHPVTTERLRFGMRVVVLAIPCAPLWRDSRGLAKAGPRCFGLDLDYVPFETRLGRRA